MTQHGISEQEWVEFSDGTGDARLRAKIEAHLSTCAECAGLHRELLEWRARLAGEGARMRQAMELPEAELERMLTESLERVGAAAPVAKRAGASEGLAMLRTLLAPVFGAGTVRAAIDAALRRTAPDGITVATWTAFAGALGDIIQPVCGMAAGRLVGRAAEALAIGQA
jgi:hypothetical protein